MRSLAWFPVALLAALLPGLAGCASRSAPQQTPEVRAAELLSSRPAPPGRTCSVVEMPLELPAADQLVDTAALTTALTSLAELRPREAERGAYVLLSMGYDRFGSNIRRAVIEHNLRPVVADSIQKLVFAQRRSFPEAEDEWGVRLRIGLEEPVSFAVGRQEYCTPRPRDANLALAMETTFGTGTRFRDGYRESTVWVRLIINPQGTVTGATLERGVVAGISTEQRILDYVRTLYFDAALADGHPVTGSVSVPVVVRERS